jgi:hypothetical protein
LRRIAYVFLPDLRVLTLGPSAYLVDGVAINGVSGGPAFHLGEHFPIIIGVVSAYIANRVTGETLPGMCVVGDVTRFHEVINHFKSMEEAKKKETPPAAVPPPPLRHQPSLFRADQGTRCEERADHQDGPRESAIREILTGYSEAYRGNDDSADGRK